MKHEANRKYMGDGRYFLRDVSEAAGNVQTAILLCTGIIAVYIALAFQWSYRVVRKYVDWVELMTSTKGDQP